jgi:serine phosphatase RsbU (regulator of sigma subunit)
VPKSIPNYLRLYREQPLLIAPVELPAGFANALEAFGHATGWRLRYETGNLPGSEVVWSTPIDTGREPRGLLTIEPDPTLERQPIDLSAAGEMASALAQLWRDLLGTQQSLIEREAELAGSVPVVEHKHEERELAGRLTAVLRGGAENLGCQAAALYLLNEATSELKLRAAWNLPASRFTVAPRALAGAIGDLEALCGHAIVLEDAEMFERWQVPETCQAAVCVPVSSPTMPLGTVWFYSFAPRTFSDPQVNIAEVVAGRLAADLERETLLTDGIEKNKQAKQVSAAATVQQNQLPRVSPLVEGWQVSGWTQSRADLGGTFHDWMVRDDNQLLIALGDCQNGGVAGALVASSVRSALRAHARHLARPHEWLARTSADLWCGSAGDQYAQLFCGLIDAAGGKLRYASAGEVSAAMIDAAGFRRLIVPSLALGTDPDAEFLPNETIMAEGAILLVASGTVLSARDAHRRPLGIEPLAQALVEHSRESANTLLEIVRDRLAHHAEEQQADWSLLVVQHRHRRSPK